jgi:hypothetical protein
MIMPFFWTLLSGCWLCFTASGIYFLPTNTKNQSWWADNKSIIDFQLNQRTRCNNFTSLLLVV